MAEQRAPGTATAAVELVGWRNPRSGRFQRVGAKARQRVRGAGRRLGTEMTRLAKEESPRGQRRGPPPHFADSWRTQLEEHEAGADVVLVNTAPHASVVIWPTRPHPIVARRARVLRFEVGGEVIFRKRVMHPGTRGNDVPGRVLRGLHGRIEREGQQVARDVQTYLAEAFE